MIEEGCNLCDNFHWQNLPFFLFFILFMLESASNCCTHSFLFSPLLWNVWIKSRIRIVFLVNLCNCRLKWHLFQKEACPPHPRGAQSPIGEASKLPFFLVRFPTRNQASFAHHSSGLHALYSFILFLQVFRCFKSRARLWMASGTGRCVRPVGGVRLRL